MPPRRLGPKSEPPGRAAVVAFAVAWYGLMYVWATSDSGALVGTVAAFALIYLFGRIMEGPPRRRTAARRTAATERAETVAWSRLWRGAPFPDRSVVLPLGLRPGRAGLRAGGNRSILLGIWTCSA